MSQESQTGLWYFLQPLLPPSLQDKTTSLDSSSLTDDVCQDDFCPCKWPRSTSVLNRDFSFPAMKHVSVKTPGLAQNVNCFESYHT